MSAEDSDRNLENLRSHLDMSQGEAPESRTSVEKQSSLSLSKKATAPRKAKKHTKTRKPNRSSAQRISARRIGGPNYGLDLEKLRQTRSKKSLHRNVNGSATQLPGNKSVTSITQTNSMSGAVTPVTVVNLGKANVPKVQELGGRRSSSRTGLNVRSRSSSSVSNQSGTLATASDYKASLEVIIRYGELLKRAVITKSWNKRFFVLTDRHLFYYPEAFDVPQEFHQIDIPPKGQIDLNLIDDIKKEKSDKSGSSFNIYTPSRTYRLQMDAPAPTPSQAEINVNLGRIGAEAWVAAISGACENAKQQHQGFSGSLQRTSFSSLKVDEVDTANMSASTYKHPTKRLIDSERFAVESARKRGAGPHRPAAIEEYDQWTPFDVAAWLYTINLHQYAEHFYKLGIDGKALKELTKKDEVLNLGVEEEDVMQFLNGVESLKAVNDLAIPEGGI